MFHKDNIFKFICVTIRSIQEVVGSAVFKFTKQKDCPTEYQVRGVEYDSVGPNGFPQIGHHASGPRYLKPEKVGHQSWTRLRCHGL